MLQPVSASLLEHAVFSKQHFDREGLIVATCSGQPIGFVHAGFGPNEAGTSLDTSTGTTHILLLRGAKDDPALSDRLLAASEDYLRSRGASVVYAGGINPLNSFYLGLYGGSEIPGVLQSNQLLCEACNRCGYGEIARVSILHCDLIQFRVPLSRKVRQLRRPMQILESVDLVPNTWWEACVWGTQQRDRFQLFDKGQQRIVATASFWDVQPLSTSWGICMAGLFDLTVDPEWRRRGCASYLLGEAFRLLKHRGVGTVEVQSMSTNQAAIELYGKLGFSLVDEGIVFRKNPYSANRSALAAVSRTGS